MKIIAVIGSGLMGRKIAGDLALYENRVFLYDRDEGNLQEAMNSITKDYEWIREERLIKREDFKGVVTKTTTLREAVERADYIFEVVIENLEVKQNLFREISELCKPDAVIASNTITLDMQDVARYAVNKERTVGIRFLNPVYFIPEVEITPSALTSGAATLSIRRLLEGMGKTLFFRSGALPLKLTPTEVERRLQARRQAQHLAERHMVDPMHYAPGLGNLALTGGHGHGGSRADEGAGDKNECSVCLVKPRDCVIRPCNHFATCHSCANLLLGGRDRCPICRGSINEVIKVFTP